MPARSRLVYALAALSFFAMPLTARSDVSSAELQAQYGGKILTLRHFLPGDHLRFDASGVPETNVEPGPWTLYGQVRVKQISLKHGVVNIRGQRVFLFYDPASKQLRDLATVEGDDHLAKQFRTKLKEWRQKAAVVEIEVQYGASNPEMPAITNAMNAVFLAPDEAIVTVVPDYWKRWVQQHTDATASGREQAIASVGKGVKPPKVTYDPDPSYSELARRAGYQGTSVLWLVVSSDGLPEQVRIQRALGLGLDEEAVKAVQRWKFEPASKDGAPVPVQINVEVNFHLY